MPSLGPPIGWSVVGGLDSYLLLLRICVQVRCRKRPSPIVVLRRTPVQLLLLITSNKAFARSRAVPPVRDTHRSPGEDRSHLEGSPISDDEPLDADGEEPDMGNPISMGLSWWTDAPLRTHAPTRSPISNLCAGRRRAFSCHSQGPTERSHPARTLHDMRKVRT